MVITRAMGRHLRSYPHARFPDHEDLLRHPLLDDHLLKGKATVRRTLGVVCAIRVSFSDILPFHVIGVLRLILFRFIHSCMLCLTVKSYEEKVNLKLLQMARVHIAKINQDPI